MVRTRKKLILMCCVAVLAVAGLGTWFYRAQELHARQDVETNLEAIAKLKVDQLVQWREQRLSEARVIMETPYYFNAISLWLSSPRRAELTGDLYLSLKALHEEFHYEDILLSDAENNVLYTLTGRRGEIHDSALPLLREAVRRREPLLTELHAEADGTHPHLSVVAPLFAPRDGTSQYLGMLILQLDARQFLYPLIREWPVQSDTAETLIAMRDGDSALFLNDLRFKENAAFKTRIPLSWTGTPVVQAVLGREGVFEGEDYRGVPVLSVTKTVPQSSWALVSKLDMEEALAEWRLRSFLLLASLAGGGLSVTITFWVLWEKTSKAGLRRQLILEREKREGESRYRTTLMSIGDGVIVTDAEGRVQLLNSVAESLTGWSEADARGKPMEEVFHIVNQDTRRLVDNPVREVMEKGVIVGLANHTVLISRKGAEFPIADSAAPIHGDGGGIVGVVLVFRDQTQEYAAQTALMTSESKFRDLFDNMLEGFTVREVLLDGEGRPTDYRFHKVNSAYERLTGLKAEAIVGRCGKEIFSELEPFWIERYGQVALTGEPVRFVGYHRMLDKHFEVFSYRTKEERVASVIRDVSERIRADEERDHLRAQLSQAQKMESVGRLAGGVAHDFNNMLGVILGNTELAMGEVDPSSPAYENLDEISKAAKRSAEITRQLLAFARKQTVAPKVIDLNENLESMLKMIRRLIGEDIDLCWLPCADLWKIRIDPTQVDQILANLATNARDAISGVGRLTIETANVTLDQPYCDTHPGFVPGDYAVLSVSDDGCGIEREQLSSIFEPFFTTKEMGKGTGLGLATVYGIVKQNGGFVHVYSEPGHGATFRIYLPRAEAQANANRPEVSESQGGTETVLVVEDEESNLKLCTRILASFGYRVLAANSPARAFELAGEHKDEIDLLLTDVVMPTMNGRELAERLCETQPGLRCIFMSGYTAEVVSHRGVLEEGMNFIHKPFSSMDLDAKIREVLDG